MSSSRQPDIRRHDTTQLTKHKDKKKHKNKPPKSPRGRRRINRSLTEAHVPESDDDSQAGAMESSSNPQDSHGNQGQGTFLSTTTSTTTATRPRSRSVGVCDPRLQGLRRFGRAVGMREALASADQLNANTPGAESSLPGAMRVRHGFVNIRADSLDQESVRKRRTSKPSTGGASSSEDTDTHSEQSGEEDHDYAEQSFGEVDSLQRRQRDRMLSTRRKTASLTDLPPGLVDVPSLSYSDPDSSRPPAPGDTTGASGGSSGGSERDGEGVVSARVGHRQDHDNDDDDDDDDDDDGDEEDECDDDEDGDAQFSAPSQRQPQHSGAGRPASAHVHAPTISVTGQRSSSRALFDFAGTDSDTATEPIPFLSPHSTFYGERELKSSSEDEDTDDYDNEADTQLAKAAPRRSRSTRSPAHCSVEDLLGASNPTDAGTSADDSITLDVASLVATIDSAEPTEQHVDSGAESRARARLVLSRQATISSLTASALVDPSRLRMLRNVAAHRHRAPAPPAPPPGSSQAEVSRARAESAPTSATASSASSSTTTTVTTSSSSSRRRPGSVSKSPLHSAQDQSAASVTADATDSSRPTEDDEPVGTTTERKRPFSSSSASLSISALREAATSDLMRTSSTMRKENEELWSLVNENLDMAVGAGLDGSMDSSDSEMPSDTEAFSDEDSHGISPQVSASTMQLSSSYLLHSTDVVVDERSLIGHGTYGSVFRGYLHGKVVAVKKITGNVRSIELLNSFEQEVEVMSQLHHPNVLMLIGACVEPDNLLIVTEMMTGNVCERLHSASAEPPSLFRRLKWAEDTCLGMSWLHRPERTYLHMDLKTQNLLIDEKGSVKVADFGLSQFFHTAETRASGSRVQLPSATRERGTDLGGTAVYRAPELMHNGEYDRKCDVYSFGIVLWELYSCKVPFKGWQLAKVIYQVSSQRARPPIDEQCPESLRRLIEDCWQHDPEKRPHFSAVLPRLQSVILELSIQSSTARAFWQQRFGTQECVPWRQFYSAFADSFAVQRSRRSRHQPVIEGCFRAMALDPEHKGQVSMRSFSDCVEYFGPLNDDQGAHFMKVIFSMVKLVYFHGDLSKEEAERRLAPFKRGTFLVRFSTKPGLWTASVRMSGRNPVGHIRLGTGGRVCENFPTFLRRQGKQYRLRHVCPCNRYEHLFAQTLPDGTEAPVDQTNYSYMMIDEPGFAPPSSLRETTV